MIEVRKFVDWEGHDFRGDELHLVVISLDLGWRRLAVGVAVNRKTNEATVRVGQSLAATVQTMDAWLSTVGAP